MATKQLYEFRTPDDNPVLVAAADRDGQGRIIKDTYITSVYTVNGSSIVGSGNYTFDSAFNELSTNALENQVVSKEFREINYEIAMIREALFEVVLSEIDYSVDYAMTYVVPDSLSDTDGTHRVVYSETELKTIGGNSVVDNQLNNNNYYNGGEVNGITFVKNNNGSWTISGTASASVERVITSFQIFANHKYLLSGCPSSGSLSSYWLSCGQISQDDTGNGIIGATGSDKTGYISIRVQSGTAISTPLTFYVQEIDLTQMFGAGNEPTTTDDVRIQWLLSRGYIAYNTGSLLSTSVSGLYSRKSDLASLPFTSIGNYTFTGQENWTKAGSQNNAGLYRYFTEISGMKSGRNQVGYCSNYPTTSNWYEETQESVCFGISNTYLQFLTTNNLTTDQVKSLFANVEILYELTTPLAQPNQDVVSFLTLSTITLPTTELKSAGSVHDYLEVVEGNVVEGEQRYNVVKHTLVGSYTFTGNENCATRTIGGTRVGYNIYGMDISPWKSQTTNAIIDKGSDSFTNDSYSYNGIELTISGGVPRVYLSFPSDTSIDTTAKALAYMQGKTIYYELATEPTPTTIATDLTFEQVSLIIQQGGTINTNFTNVPPNVTTTFVVKKAVGE